MKIKRDGVFETNSSSTHSLTTRTWNTTYLPPGDKIIVQFIDTDDDTLYSTLREKVSYLVGQIINRYKWDCLNYEDLVEQVQASYDFKNLSEFVEKKYGKKIVFPEHYNGSLEDIVYVNHQITYSSLDEVLADLAEPRNLLNEILDENMVIEIGHD